MTPAETDARALAAALWPGCDVRVDTYVGSPVWYGPWVQQGGAARAMLPTASTEAEAWEALAGYLRAQATARLAEIDGLAAERARLASALGEGER